MFRFIFWFYDLDTLVRALEEQNVERDKFKFVFSKSRWRFLNGDQKEETKQQHKMPQKWFQKIPD